MIDLFRLGDKADHGGLGVGVSDDTEFGGYQIAREGEEITCTLHDIKPSLLIEGDETTSDAGLTVARHGHLAMCSSRPLSNSL
jgi:uncharacterized Zn-binding protein involved in type VI secretion